MAAQRKFKLLVAAYLPNGEQHPVLQVVTSTPPRGALGGYFSPVIRRADTGYRELLRICENKPIWLYQQSPLPLL